MLESVCESCIELVHFMQVVLLRILRKPSIQEVRYLLPISSISEKCKDVEPAEPVPEETFICSHLSWSSIIPYLLHPSSTIHGILPVQSTCLTVFFHNLSSIFGRPYYQTCLWYTVSVCLSSVVCLSVTFCIVAKQYVLAKNCLKE